MRPQTLYFQAMLLRTKGNILLLESLFLNYHVAFPLLRIILTTRLGQNQITLSIETMLHYFKVNENPTKHFAVSHISVLFYKEIF